jgi:iron complex outermembrane receptor protein
MKRILLITTALVSAHATPLLAQATTPAAAPEKGLAEIVVTAQRRSESSQKAAIAIDVVSAKDLAKAGTITAASLNAVAPALVVTQLGGPNTSYFVRGVGNFTGNAYSDPAIAFSLDGVYLGRPTSTTGTFYDLDRVEVLKGPQGTLYGRNATGGAVNVLPTKPILGSLSGYATAGYGSFNAYDLEGAINLPVGDTTAIRVSGKLSKHDGYNSDGTDDLDSKAFRVQILTKPTDTLSIRVGVDYSYNGGLGAGANYTGTIASSPGSQNTLTTYSFVPANLPDRIGLLAPAARAYYSHQAIIPSFIFPAPISTPYLSNNYWGVYADINLKTAAGTLTVIPAYRDSLLHSNFNGPSFAGGLLNDHDKQYSVEVRFAGKAIGPVDWLIGGYYFKESIDAIDTYSQYFVQSYQNFNTGTESYAGFGRLTYHVTDKLRLVGGLRYTHDKKTFSGEADTLLEFCNNGPPGFCFGGPSVPVAVSIADVSAKTGVAIHPGPPVAYGTRGNTLLDLPFVLNTSQANSKLTYRLSAEYDLAPKVLGYASYETGYRSGGFSFAPGYTTYLPETLTAATIGVKSRFLDNRAQLNVELFRWKYKNQQVAHFGIDATGATNNFTQNIGQATIQGADIDARFLLTKTTLLTGSVQYLDTNLDSFTYAAAGGGAPPITGCAITANNVVANVAGTYTVDCSGKPESNSPKWSVNLGLEQTFNVQDYKIVVTGDMRYRGSQNTGFEYLPQQTTGANTIFDATLSFGPKNDRWSISAYIRNIGDIQVANITQFIGSNGNTVTTQYAPPRTYGVRITGKF